MLGACKDLDEEDCMQPKRTVLGREHTNAYLEAQEKDRNTKEGGEHPCAPSKAKEETRETHHHMCSLQLVNIVPCPINPSAADRSINQQIKRDFIWGYVPSPHPSQDLLCFFQLPRKGEGL